MSLLKEQWGLLQRTRAGATPSPIRSLRSSSPRPHATSVTPTGPIQIKPEFEAFRAKVQSRMAALQDIGIGLKREPAPGAAKQFLWGLNGKRAEERKEKGKQEAKERGEVRNIEQVTRLGEAGKWVEGAAEDSAMFEAASVAHKAYLSNYVENPDKDITLTGDIGPLARLQAGLRPQDVFPTVSQPLDAFSKAMSDDRLEFADIANFCLGRIPHKRLIEQFRLPFPTEKPSKGLSIIIDTPQSVTTPANQGRGVGSLSKSKSEVPELLEHAEDLAMGVNKQQLEGEVEVRIAELMTSIRESEGEGDKVGKLLEQFQQEHSQARSEHERLKARLLIQFLQEYQRVKEARGSKKAHLKPAVPRVRRTPKSSVQPALDPSVYYYSPSSSRGPTESFHPDSETRQGRSTGTRRESQTSAAGSAGQVQGALVAGGKRSYANATAASIGKGMRKQQEAEPTTLWIGGNRHKDEFDDPNWVSPPDDSTKRKSQPRQTHHKPS